MLRRYSFKLCYLGWIQHITLQEGSSLEEVLEIALEKYLEDLSHVSSQASKEHGLEKVLNKMKMDWKGVYFSFSSYKDTGILVLTAVVCI